MGLKYISPNPRKPKSISSIQATQRVPNMSECDAESKTTTNTSSNSSSSSSSSCSSADWPVTEEWLQAVLKHHHQSDLPDPHHVQVCDFTVKPGCDVRENVLSDILAVMVKYRLSDDDGDNAADGVHALSFIIKLLPQDPFSRFFVTEAQFDLREINFYTQIVPDLDRFQTEHLRDGTAPIPLPIPKCFYAHYAAGATTTPEPTPPESVLVLENVKPRGFAGAQFARGLTLRQTRAAIAAIARVHALSLAQKVRDGRPLHERYPFLFQTSRATDSYQQLVERGLPQLAQFLERRAGLETVLECLHAIRPRTKEVIEALLAPEEDPLSLITHTDFWCNNLMFRERPEVEGVDNDDENTSECIILDWQMVTFSRPTNDIALLIISSLPAELRRAHAHKLLDEYWACLTTNCRKVGLDIETELKYDRTRLDAAYRRSQLLALLLCIGSVDVALGDPRTEERLVDLLRDLHADGVLNQDVI